MTASTARSIGCRPTRWRWNSAWSAASGELFALEYYLLLYDVTRVYFEGQAAQM
jgi:hypothetical protein